MNTKPAQRLARKKTAKKRAPENRTETGKFKKGQSGNPGGRPKEDRHLRELARERTIEAVETLSKIMRGKGHPAAARVSAACALLDRGYGRPAQAMEVTGKDGKPIQSELITAALEPKEAARLYKEFLHEG